MMDLFVRFITLHVEESIRHLPVQLQKLLVPVLALLFLLGFILNVEGDKKR